MPAAAKCCPFCGSGETAKVSDFGTSLMVALHRCGRCHSYFEAIKWGERSGLDLPRFLDDARTAND